MPSAARLIRIGEDVHWLCPCCRRMLGEIRNSEVTIKLGHRFVTFPVSADVRQSCPKCNETSFINTKQYVQRR